MENYIFVSSIGQIVGMITGSSELADLNAPTDDCVRIKVDSLPKPSDDDTVTYYDFLSAATVESTHRPNINYVFNFSTRTWTDSRSLDDIKEQKWRNVKQQRNALEFGGFEFEGNRYDSDQISQGRIVAAASLGVEVEWTLQNNSAIWLSPAKLKELQIALAMHVTQVHARGKAAREAIYAATTQAEIEAVAY